MNQPYKKKLIEVAIPLEAINAASAREKSIRHGHPSTLHLWWARRPLAACRAVLFAQLVDDPSSLPDQFPTAELQDAERKRLFAIIEDLVKWENSTNEEVLERARAEIRRCCGGVLPPVYDPFSGGGSIPLEAQRLGLPAFGSDLNPVAVLIGKAMIEIPPKFKDQKPIHPGIKERNHYRNAEGLAEDVLYYARSMSEKAWLKIGHLYPQITLAKRDGGGAGTILAWLWARTVASPNPAMRGSRVPLISSYWLCKKEKKQAWVLPVVNGTTTTFEVGYGTPPNPDLIDAGTKAGRGANFRCILTGDAITSEYVKAEGMAGRMGWQLMAIVAEGTKGRVYVAPSKEQEAIAFSEKPSWRPEFPLSQHPQYMSVTNYGPTNISDLFMDRQTIALNTFIELIPEVISEVSGSEEYRKALATYLSLGVSRLANRQSTSTFWDNGAENIQQVFAMQALPMRWDTAEGNPFSTSTGNFMGQVEYLAKNVAALPAWGGPGHIEQSNAQSVNFAERVISTDPPYYDNVPYADLSDFFYVWLRKALREYYPALFETVLVPKAEELVADHKRHNGRDAADSFFLNGMTEVMRHMAEQGRKDTPTTIYYAFRQGEVEEGGLSSKGWATFLQAVIAAGFQIGATWPVRTELVGNLKKTKNALATSVVLSCRSRPTKAETVSRSEFIRALKRELPAAMVEMQRASIAPVDMPQASIGPGIGIFSRYAAVIESDDSAMSVKSALQIINQQLDEFLSEQEGAFDPDTRFAVTWYTQNGYGFGLFGDADNLARARGISVDSVKHAGIVESQAGKVRILRRDELDTEWEPEEDTHLTVWECCQHLVRLHEKHGIGYETAVMLKKFGSDKAEAVKDLAYILYDLCANKRQDAKEATAYNALIADWSDLTREAAVVPLSNRSGQMKFEV
jgi:putative DNA methylase